MALQAAEQNFHLDIVIILRKCCEEALRQWNESRINFVSAEEADTEEHCFANSTHIGRRLRVKNPKYRFSHFQILLLLCFFIIFILSFWFRVG